jgi:hypothetical protein
MSAADSSAAARREKITESKSRRGQRIAEGIGGAPPSKSGGERK